MINPKSTTLREFSFKVKTKNKETIKVKFGYDASMKNAGYYIQTSINNGAFSENDYKTITKLRSLKIKQINELIDAIGTDNTGAPYNYEQVALEIITKFTNTPDTKYLNQLVSLYRISADDIYEINRFKTFIGKYSRATGARKLDILKQYNNSRRLAFLELSRSVVQGVKELLASGITVNGQTSQITPKKSYSPSYYKRDIDYVRKARVKVFKKILGMKYVPFK